MSTRRVKSSRPDNMPLASLHFFHRRLRWRSSCSSELFLFGEACDACRNPFQLPPTCCVARVSPRGVGVQRTAWGRATIHGWGIAHSPPHHHPPTTPLKIKAPEASEPFSVTRQTNGYPYLDLRCLCIRRDRRQPDGRIAERPSFVRLSACQRAGEWRGWRRGAMRCEIGISHVTDVHREFTERVDED